MPTIAQLNRALTGRYGLEGVIGEGGMATVFLAHDVRHDRQVALKVLKPDVGDWLGVDRFLAEIQVTAKLQHPHVLPLFDSGVAEGNLFYVMPFVRGESLRMRIERGPLEVGEALRIVIAVASALDHAHRQGVVHRDIKPENILMQDGHALVADFGIALALRGLGDQRLTAAGTSLGTPAYMSPEQVTGGHAIDGRSDQYALGCLLYEMVSGRPPFSATSAHGVMVKHVTEAAPMLHAPRAVADAVSRALGKEPAERYSTVVEFAEAASRGGDSVAPVRAIGPAPVTIAVLPFTNRSPDEDNEYFSDGLTDEVISDLSKVKAIRVISRVSSNQYKGTVKSARTIGLELAVRYVVSGTVRRFGDSLRVTAELVEAESEATIWSDKLQGTVADVFEVQERLSRQIVDALQVSVTPEESRRIATRPIENLRAYESYLRARYLIYKFDPQALTEARSAVFEAMSMVGENAQLHGTLAMIQWMAANLGVQLDESSVAMAHAHADRAMALSPDSVIGYTAKGFIASKGKAGSCVTAAPWLRRALEIERDPDALLFLAWYLAESGECSDAVACGEEAVLVDPLNFFAHAAGAVALVFSGQAEAARSAAAQVSACDPENFTAVVFDGQLRFIAGDAEGGRDRLAHAVTLIPPQLGDMTLVRAARAFAAAVCGNSAVATACLDAAVEEWFGSDEWFCCWAVWIYALLGDRNKVLHWLGRAIDRGVTNDRWWGEWDPVVAPYREDPEFQNLVLKAKRLREANRASGQAMSTG